MNTRRRHTAPRFPGRLRILSGAVAGCAIGAASATPLPLQHGPWGLGQAAAPNIIVSVDNSTSMGSSGIAALKAALRATFSSTNLPDNKIRLAWQAMHGCNAIPGSNTSTGGPCKGYNGMRRFGGAHRTHFNNWVDSIAMSRGTPTHWIMKNAGDYLSATGLGVNSPWALNPGTEEAPLLACRRSYHILMTDGEYGHSAWSTGEKDMSGPDGVRIVRGGNADGTDTTLPDGTPYSTSSDQTKLYRDSWGSSTHSSLSDLSFHYWSRDLQPGIDNRLQPPAQQQLGAEEFGTATHSARLDPYWNPRNNPATWQHMVNYTIGFLEASSWSGAPVWHGDTFTGLGGLIRGNVGWETPFCGPKSSGSGNLPCDGGANYVSRGDPRKAELWHAALNSRGRFVPAPDANALVVAFQNILNEITVAPSAGAASIAATSGRHLQDRLLYEAAYNSERWSGDVIAWDWSASSASRGSSPAWRASAWLDNKGLDIADRRIYTHSDGSGAAFTWDAIDSDQKALLQNGAAVSVGRQRLDHLRGDRGAEVDNGGTLRNRASRLGSIINSNLWITPPPRRLRHEWSGHSEFRSAWSGRPAMLYVGANDGMLHGFDAQTGAERLAYVPRGVYATARDATAPGFAFKATVDGHPFTADADLSWISKDTPASAANWRTLLAGTLGAGGRGYFVLDVTDPANFGASHVLLDRSFPANATDTQVLHADVGHLHAAAVVDGVLTQRSEQIVKLNNGRWALLMGNGINSVNERPVLLIQYLDGDRALLPIVAHSTTSAGNGLGPVRPIDVDGNGTVDVAYAGDLKGQLWKFNLIHKEDAQWGVVVWDGTGSTCKNATTCVPFLRVTDPDNASLGQPITTAPAWLPHPLGGIQLLFGTGQLLQPTDPTIKVVQTVYSVWDKSAYKPTASALSASDTEPLSEANIRTRLVEQPVTGAIPVVDASNLTHHDAYQASASNPVVYSRQSADAPRGWYVNLPAAGERLVVHPLSFLGRKAIFTTTAPSDASAEESCDTPDAAGQHWLNVRDFITGQPPAGGVFHTPGIRTSIDTATRARVGSNEFVLLPGADQRFHIAQTQGKKNDNGVGPKELKDVAAPPARADWRELRP